MGVAAVVVFALTYALISARQLDWLGMDRPAGALLGAVAIVAIGVLSPAEAIAAVDGPTLLLLFGVMGMGAFLGLEGFFDALESKAVRWTKTPAGLLGGVVWSSGALSALITNDAVCVLGAPIVVRLIVRQRLPALPFLLALATAANTGSVATLVGNPQNMLCGVLGGLSYREHLVLVGPVAVAGLAINHAVLWLMFRRALPARSLTRSTTSPPVARRSLVTLVVIGATAAGYTLGTNLAWTAAGGFVALMLVHRRSTRELWPRIDWSLLLFFAGLFVVVEGLMRSGLPAELFSRFPLATSGTAIGATGPGPAVASHGGVLEALRLSGIFLIGSNVVSNVPFILVVREQMAALVDPRLGWELLAMAATFAGNLTLLGSVANIIVAEAARDIGGLGFWPHLRVGAPIGLLTTIVGAVWMGWVGG